MKAHLLALSALALLAACQPKQQAASSSSAAPAAPPPPIALTLDCGGPFTRDASKATLVALLGDANVQDQTVPGPEGQDMQATVLFPTDTKRRVEIAWIDETKKAGIADASITGEASEWTGPHGMKLGMKLDEIEKLNGAPFKITGFGWDYGGYVVDWNGGVLKRGANTCGPTVRLEPADGADINGAQGDAQFSSNTPGVRKANARLVRLSIGYAATPRDPKAPIDVPAQQ